MAPGGVVGVGPEGEVPVAFQPVASERASESSGASDAAGGMGSGGRHRSTDGGDAAQPVASGSPRAAATLDERGRELLERLVQLALAGLPLMYRAESDIFAHTRAFQLHNRVLHGELRGTSPRYSAIVALGANWLPEA